MEITKIIIVTKSDNIRANAEVIYRRITSLNKCSNVTYRRVFNLLNHLNTSTLIKLMKPNTYFIKLQYISSLDILGGSAIPTYNKEFITNIEYNNGTVLLDLTKNNKFKLKG